MLRANFLPASRHCITGALPPTPNPLPLPTHMVQSGDFCRNLVDATFSAGQASHDRCILTPKNETADTINAVFRESLPGDLHVYESADYFGEDSEAQSNIYPNEFLNTLLPSGLAQHRLNLKVGAPIILIRNLNWPYEWHPIGCYFVSSLHNQSNGADRNTQRKLRLHTPD